MIVLLDTNIILDVILKRDPYINDAVRILSLSDSKEIDSFITANSVTDIYYIIRKSFDSVEDRKNAIKFILNIVSIVSVTETDVLKALDFDFSDFEDALQTQCALKMKANFIITRNVKDFKHKGITAITPKDFLLKYFD
jgi:predicted nucleic acid-binding protein